MVDIAKFKTELIEAVTVRRSQNSEAMEHAKQLLRPFIEIAAAVEDVFPNTVILGDMEPEGSSCSTSFCVADKWIYFYTQPGSNVFTIEGINDELDKTIPKEQSAIKIIIDPSQFSNEREISIDQIENAAQAFASFLKNELIASL